MHNTTSLPDDDATTATRRHTCTDACSVCLSGRKEHVVSQINTFASLRLHHGVGPISLYIRIDPHMTMQDLSTEL